jgi:hypothetical protein
MRKLLASIFVLAFSLVGYGQNPPCPTIKITGPSSTVLPGESMTITANVEDFDLNKIGYEWSVSNGTIAEGQNTPVIKVDTTGLNQTPITATVKIKPLPVGCADSVSETGVVAGGDIQYPLMNTKKSLGKKKKLD